MSKLIRRLRWLLGYKPLRIPTAVPPDRYCISETPVIIVPGPRCFPPDARGIEDGMVQIPGWKYTYCDGTEEWVSEARPKR
jgi:hypothetical protein